MSADNWGTCPKCHAKWVDSMTRLSADVEAKYGKIPAAEWEKLRASSRTAKDYEDSTLREDYEIGIYNGKFYFSYSGRCEPCGFSFQRKHEEPV